MDKKFGEMTKVPDEYDDDGEPLRYIQNIFRIKLYHLCSNFVGSMFTIAQIQESRNYMITSIPFTN